MAVTLLRDLDPAAEADRLAAWAASYRPGPSPHGWFAPARPDWQRWVAEIRGVGRDEVSPSDLADPGLLIGHGTTRNPAHRAWLAPDAVAFGGHHVLAEWKLDELAEVRALDDLTGIVLLAHKPNPDYDDRFPALLCDVVRYSARAFGSPPPGYDRRRVEVDWLKFEAVFADRRGRLNQWLAGLRPRLDRIVQNHDG